MAKKKRVARSLPSSSRRLREELDDVDRLLERKKPGEARQILDKLDRQHPNQPDILRFLVDVCYESQDWHAYEWAIYRLNRLERSDPDIVTGLAGVYMTQFRPALALRAFERFLTRWPDHPRSAETRQTAVELREEILKEESVPGQPEEEVIEMMVQHDEVRFFLEHGQFQRARQLAQKLIKRYPDFVSVLNNLAQLHVLEGNRQLALAVSFRVLEIDADNVHALANLTRLLFLNGDFEAANAMAQRLVASHAPAMDRLAKMAEALSLIGDDAGVLELYEEAEPMEGQASSESSPLFLHFVAVALANKGEVEKAHLLWRKVLELDRAFELSRLNLDDLKRTPGERNGPWAFPLSSWMSPNLFRELATARPRSAKRRTEHGVQATAPRFLQRHPELVALIPHMLARGGPDTLEFVVNLSFLVETSDLLGALEDFALGQRGSDQLRLKAAHSLSERGVLASGINHMWMNGEWRDLLLWEVEVTSEPEHEYETPELRELAEKAIHALRDGDGKQAQAYLDKALALEPDSPSLHNNLALAYELQGRDVLAHAIVRETHARFPDYFFGIVGVARLDIEEGDLETARSLLNDLMQRKRMHVTEFDAFCVAQIEFGLAEKNQEVAKRWFQMWAQPDPEDPKLRYYRERLFGQTGLDRFLGRGRR